MASRRFDIKITSNGIAGALTGDNYHAEAFEGGRKLGLYAYGGTGDDAARRVMQKLRDIYGSDIDVRY